MKQIATDRLAVHKKLLNEYEANCLDKVIKASEMIIKCIKNNGCVYLCGNGGSAADSQHVAGELVGRFARDRKALPAVALSTDTSIITSIANDVRFEDCFARQVEALVGPEDILWAFSTSGTSKNVINAANLAKQKHAKVLAFTGKNNTPLEAISDVAIVINAPNTAAAQEIHQLAYHTICDLVERAFSKEG